MLFRAFAQLCSTGTWTGTATLQFSFDMSVPNVAHLDPQKGGCCTVMPYFFGNTLEIPVTTTQDYMLFHLLNDYSLDLWKEQVDLIVAKKWAGEFYCSSGLRDRGEARSTYRELLAFLCGRKAKEDVVRPSHSNRRMVASATWYAHRRRGGRLARHR